MSVNLESGPTTLYRAPSGRHHTSRGCTAGAGRRMVRVVLSDARLAPMNYLGGDGELCRCALGARDRAMARLAEKDALAPAIATASHILTQTRKAALHRIRHTPDAATRDRMLDHLRHELIRWEES